MKKFYSSFISLVLSAVSLCGQDAHFSQFHASPLNMNPALTGIVDVDYRVAFNYRTQWSGITVPFKTIAASYDMAMKKYKRSGDIVGIGLIFQNDKAGDAGLKTTQIGVTLSYVKALNKSRNKYLSIGLKAGVGQRDLNVSALSFDSQFNGSSYDPNAATGENIVIENLSWLDISPGVLYYYAPGRRQNYFFGVASYHVNNPKQSFYGQESIKLATRHTIHAGAQFPLNGKMDILPSMLLLRQGSYQEANVGGYVKFLFSGKIEGVGSGAYIGMWYRFRDALIPSIKMDIERFSFGLSYDINVSRLSKASNFQGGPELSLTYLDNLPKKNRNNGKQKAIFCPRFN